MGLTVDCTCDPLEKNGYKFVQWIGSVFGDCIYTPLEKFSYYAGVISILLYFIAFYPQIYENYKRKSTSGLSLVLIIIWFFGDFANYIGTVLTEQYPIQKVVGIYFALMEVIIIGQYIYYKTFYPNGNNEEDDEEEENRDIIITTDGEDQNKNQKQNENENHIQSEEEGDPKQKLLQGSPQHTYETFSDNQQIPIQPPPSNSPKNNIYSTADNDSLSSSVISKCSNQSSNIQMTSENSLKEEPKKEDLESKPKVELEKEEEPKQEPEPESKPESKPEPEEIVEKKESPKESVSETKYETFDEISQKQKLDIPVFEIPSNIKKDSNENSYSTSVSNSISKANIRSNKSNDSQESLNNSSNSSSNSSSNNDEDDDGDECEKSNDNSPEDSISGDVSQLSIDTRDENEEGDKESKSPLNKKSKKKSKKGKKGKKGKKNKRGRGLATQIQTVLLLSLFILQIQARALDYTGKLEGFNHQSNLGLNPDEYPKICNESPNLTLGQKIFGSLMAWSSGLLYFTCRIPQILENKRNRSVEGLSILLFICTILGNFFYGLSILIRFPPINTKFFTGTLPYLIGSVGTFIFDVMIIYQFNAYKPSNSHYERIE